MESGEVTEHARLAREGVLGSLDELWLKYRKLGRTVLRKYRISWEDKDSVVWEAICRAIRSYEPHKGTFSAYMRRWCAHYAARLARKLRGASCASSFGYEDYQAQMVVGPDELLGLKRRQATVRRAIQELPERQRLIVEWQMRGLGPAETAARLGVSKQRVHSINLKFEKRVMEAAS